MQSQGPFVIRKVDDVRQLVQAVKLGTNSVFTISKRQINPISMEEVLLTFPNCWDKDVISLINRPQVLPQPTQLFPPAPLEDIGDTTLDPDILHATEQLEEVIPSLTQRDFVQHSQDKPLDLGPPLETVGVKRLESKLPIITSAPDPFLPSLPPETTSETTILPDSLYPQINDLNSPTIDDLTCPTIDELNCPTLPQVS